MNIDYSKLRETDYIYTTSLHTISNIIRFKQTGRIFDTGIATHIGILVDIHGKLFIAEMVKRLQINSLKRCYLEQGYFGNRIVMVRRNPIYDDPQIRYETNSKIISDYFETLSYDYKGILSYVFPHSFHNDPSKFWCSEYTEKLAQGAGNSIKPYKPTPWDFQTSKKLITIDNWKI